MCVSLSWKTWVDFKLVGWLSCKICGVRKGDVLFTFVYTSLRLLQVPLPAHQLPLHLLPLLLLTLEQAVLIQPLPLLLVAYLVCWVTCLDFHQVCFRSVKVPSSHTCNNTGGAGANSGGNMASQMAAMQQQLLQNPEMMRQMMESPLMQSMLNNPEALRNMFTSNPQMQQLLEVGW